ncbi:MAG: DUF2497 domain-containing protein, partial [Catenulispora sp.]|nr:DUF2497 domain-containing protein [Catenulispora sp.]
MTQPAATEPTPGPAPAPAQATAQPPRPASAPSTPADPTALLHGLDNVLPARRGRDKDLHQHPELSF